ncbi:MAG: Signal transduction histidine-protein kinase AtoS [Chlamydiales bacterium]|nr:Signal transduction histidine-protein kinase AtoS [Chlamydiales bacterium]MCH9619363.1 Signal transduction histidine-protein kinase AtoS [Chlamydiales bacterium]MCH9622167.1 Signal transduction histidine-protein kinase AtoS [Chlamydiales bacterium]
MKLSELEPLFFELKNQLKQMESLYTIVETLPDGMIFITTKGVISLCNAMACQLLKMDPVKSIPFEEVFDDTFFGFSMKEALSMPEKRRRVFLSLSDGKEVEVSTSSTTEGIALLLHDRTEIAHLERSVHQSHQLAQLGEMAARLAHEIRNPLGGIEGFASMLKNELKDQEMQKMASSIVDGTRTLNALVTSILDYAKPLSLHFAPTDLVEIASDCTQLLGEKVVLVCEVKTWIVSADKERLKLALLNLIHNGWEASEKQVTLTISKGKLTIEDKGCGIPKENLEKIFTPFFTTKTFGTGLGLAEAKKVVEAHSGKLEIKSIEGKGTTIGLTL